MNYRGTIAYRANQGGAVSEGFLWSVVNAWDFMKRELGEFDILSDPEFVGKTVEYFVSHNVHFMRGLSCMPDESANQIAETFLGDWVLMLDTDHMFSADTFLEMIRTFENPPPVYSNTSGEEVVSELDILVGFTQKRVPPYHPVIYKTAFDARVDFETIFPDALQRQQLIEVDSSGAACLMIRRRVFDAIKNCGERPFDRRRKWNIPGMSTLKGNDIPVMRNCVRGYDTPLPEGRWIDETFGEDTSFFWRAKMLGFKAWCAPWIKFNHLETRLVTESMMIEDKMKAIPK